MQITLFTKSYDVNHKTVMAKYLVKYNPISMMNKKNGSIWPPIGVLFV
jgi:hypothetical protein